MTDVNPAVKRLLDDYHERQARAHPCSSCGEPRGRCKPDCELAAYVKRIVDTAPPLTDEVADRIANLLRPRPGDWLYEVESAVRADDVPRLTELLDDRTHELP